MRWRILVGAVAVTAAVLTLHTTVLEKIGIGGAKPDLLLAIVVYISLMKGSVSGTALGFALGLLQDAQSHHVLGLNALAKAVSGFAAGRVWEGLDKENPVTQMLVLFGTALIHNLIFLVLYTWAEIGAVPALMLRTGIPGALYTGVAAPLLMQLVQRVFHFRMRFNGPPGRYS